MGTQLVRTLEAVRFLNDYAPAKLEGLRSIYPDVPLSTKKMLGGVVEDEFDASMAKIELTVVVAALREVGPAIPLAMNRSNVRMRAARRLTLASTIVGVVSTASIITVLATDYPKTGAYIAAVLNLIALVVPAVANYKTFVYEADKGDIQAILKSLWDLEHQSNLLLAKLQFCLEHECSIPEMTQLSGQGNELLMKIREQLSRLAE